MALPWEEDYTVKQSEDEGQSSALPWEDDYTTGSKYSNAVRQEESEWEKFTHAFQKAKNLTESAGDILETHIPLGRIQFTNPETGEIDIEYQPPTEELKDAVKKGDTEMAMLLLNNQREERLQKMYPDLYTDDGVQKANTENIWGDILGYVADPSTLIPFAAGWKGMVASGAAFGGIDASLHSKAKDGDIDFGDVMLGTVAGAVLPAALKGAGKAVGIHHWKDSVNAARKQLDKFDKGVLKDVARGIPLSDAQYVNAIKHGFSRGMADVDDAVKKAGRLKTHYQGLTPDTAVDALEQIELNARKNWFNKGGYLKKAAEFAGDYITPISTRIEKISPRLYHALRRMDMETHVAVHERMERAQPWFKFVKEVRKTSPELEAKLKKSILGENFKSAYGLIARLEGTNPAFKGMRESFNDVRKLMDELADEAVGAGYKLDKMKFYYPRLVRHPEGLGVVRKSVIAKKVSQEAKRKKRKLTSAEFQHIIEKTINGYRAEMGKTAKSLRNRKFDYMADEMLPHYADLDEALAGYIREMTHTVQRRKFLKAHSDPKKLPKAKTKGENIDKSIAAVLNKERQRLKLSPDQEDKLTRMLVSRFGAGERAPREGIRTFKNITYGATLGNIISAITQLGDNAFGMFMHGFRPHMRALGENLKGSRFIPGKRADDFVEKTVIGLTEITEDIMNDTSKSKKFLDTLMKWSGFAQMDKFGKENLINGAIQQAKRLAKTDTGRRKFMQKWLPYFEGQTLSLLKNLEKGNVADENVKLFLWHSLSNAQPIGLSEMPEGYLRHPNGRVFYMLKTFTIKQLDLMRREIWDLAEQGRTTEAASKMAMFATLFMMWNGGAEAMKDVLKGKDVEIPDIAVNNLIKVTGLSRWDTDKFGRNGPLETISQMIIPPYPIDDLYKGAMQGDPVQAMRASPYIGFLSGWLKDE